MQDIRLSVGDGATTDSVSFATQTCYVERQGFRIDPYDPGKPTRAIEMRVRILGTAESSVAQTLAAIGRKLTQAETLSSDPYSAQWVTLSIKDWRGNWYYWDVVSGQYAVEWWGPGNTFASVVLRLECLPFARGDVVTIGQQSLACGQVWLVDVPGDAPALARIELAGASSVVSMRVFRHAEPGLASGEFVALADLDGTADGSTTVSDATAYGGAYVSRSVSASFAGIGRASRPAAKVNGLFDVWARVRDSSTFLPQPSPPSVTVIRVPSPIQVASNAVNDSTLSVSLERPAQAGNTLIAVLAAEGTNITIPSGWTLLASANRGSSPDIAILVYRRSARGGEQSIEFSFGSIATRSAILAEFYGNIGFETYASSAATSSTPSSPVMSPGTGNKLFLAVLGYLGGAVVTGEGTSDPWNHMQYVPAYRAIDVDWLSHPSTSSSNRSQSWTLSASSPWVTLILRFSASSATGYPFAPTMSQFALVATNATGISAPSLIVIATLDVYGYYTVSWSPVSGASGYRLYVNHGDGWSYVTTTSTSFTLTAATSTTTGNPPSGAADRAEWQLAARVGASGSWNYAAPVPSARGGNVWHWLYLGAIELPPGPRALDGSVPSWQVRLLARHRGSSVTVAADCVLLVPHREPQLVAERVGEPGVTYVVEVTRREHAVGHLLDSANVVVGRPVVRGALVLDPGPNAVALQVANGSDGAISTMSPTYTVTLKVTPRYQTVPGVS